MYVRKMISCEERPNRKNARMVFEEINRRPGMVVHACNPSY
jgi:hypothetical protein